MSKSDAGYQRSVCYTENAGLSKSNVRFHRTAGYSITRKMIIQDREGMGRREGGGMSVLFKGSGLSVIPVSCQRSDNEFSQERRYRSRVRAVQGRVGYRRSVSL